MTTTFEDNQAVTLADLNGIAIDLGATAFSAFSEEKFGVDKLNEITKALVTSGILRTEEADGSLILGCSLAYESGSLTIGKGTVVFESGAKIYIEETALTVEKGSFVYAYNDIPTGRASLIASDTEPTDGDFVMLCEISSTGGLYDRRRAAQAKATMPVGGYARSFVYTLDIANGQTMTVDLGTSDFSKIILNEVYRTISGVRYGPVTVAYHNVKEIADGETVEFKFGTSESSHTSWLSVSFTKDGQNLVITAMEQSRSDNWEYHFDVI